MLVHIDVDGAAPHPASLAALAAGRHIASSWGATLYAAIVAHDDRAQPPGATLHAAGIEALQTALALAGSDKVLVATTDAPIAPLWSSVGSAWQGIVDHLRPRLVLFGADSPSAAELGPRTGARIGARLLMRAHAIGVEDVELRDRDGGYVRVSDSGAAVALVGATSHPVAGDDDADFTSLAFSHADKRVELTTTSPAGSIHARTLIVLGDDVLETIDRTALTTLATLLDARLIGGPAAMRAGFITAEDVVDRHAPLAPELCILVGATHVDIAGAASVIRIGGGGKHVDGTLSDPLELGALVRAVEARA